MDMNSYIKSNGADDLAKRLGTSPAYLRQIGSGHRKASVDLARRIIYETGRQVTFKDLLPDVFELVSAEIKECECGYEINSACPGKTKEGS